MQVVLSLIFLSFIASAQNTKSEEQIFKSEVWIVDKNLSADSEQLKAHDSEDYKARVLVHHRIGHAEQIQNALLASGCEPIPAVSMGSNPFRPAGAKGDRYQITSKTCKVMKNSPDVHCESGFFARNIKDAPNLAAYKVCIKAAPTEYTTQKGKVAN